jgi:isocitrate dehydrogenase
MTLKVAVAAGDGIGNEIMEGVLSIFSAAQVPIEFVPVEMGKSLFERGFSSGMTPEAQATIERLGVLFKGPMETPKGKGVKSINVTARKVWNTYANKRVFKTLSGVSTPFSKAGIPINITIVRENIEDTYGGIEHFLTNDVALCRRFITRPGSEQVHRYAFEMAKKNGLKKVTCGHKANIMKLTDGLFLEVFYAVAKEYPEIEANDVIVDDLAMKLVRRPDQFEVIVLPNLQGDIISDLCAGLVGGLGFAPSANIGDSISIFEAVHGTAPDIAGKGIANPTSLLMSGLMMLRHLGLGDHAAVIEQALFQSLIAGDHTGDFGEAGTKNLSTKEFVAAIISRLKLDGAMTESNKSRSPANQGVMSHNRDTSAPTQHRVISKPVDGVSVMGADYFIESYDQPGVIAEKIKPLLPETMTLTLISNRGTQVWPTGSFYTDCVGQHRVRIEMKSGEATRGELFKLGEAISEITPVCSIEVLLGLEGRPAYTRAQGQ